MAFAAERIELQRILAGGGPARVEPVKQPLAGFHRELLLARADAHVHRNAVRDAMAVSDDERRAGIGFGLHERAQGLLVLSAQRHAGHVDVAVGHGDEAKVFLAHHLAAGGELRHRAARRGFGHLPAGVGINFRVEHEHVHIAAAGQHVVEAAVTDVVSPAVAADIHTLLRTS